ncbi:phosphotransferase family protein [Tomitella gaofuii]|uniref:phosphotransferase family protein n=1 Tax=Tomitella gaofuii TaxID=2760083 RepID=UPI0015F78A23|nr:phosphotransferase family protein [Tomitella gaofuii]
MAVDTVGIAGDAVSAWFAAHVPGASGTLRFTQIAGGRSNLTFAVQGADPAQRWVLRRPPLGRVSGNAHDVVREADVLRRVAGTGVPVPAVLGVCEDPGVNGAPFFVMERVDGAVLRRPDDFALFPAAEQRRRIALALIDELARLHRADLDRSGWGARAGQRGFIARQLGRWSDNWEADRVRVLADIGRTRDALAAAVPEQQRASVVHGDFRLDNCLIAPDCSITGVLDWELTTVGDPLADLGHFLVYWAQPGDEVTALQNPPTLVEGLPGRDELTGRYLDAMRGAVDADAAPIDYYVAFSWWKTACIVENVYTRMARGAMGDADRTPESFALQAERLAARAWELARALP